MIIYIEKSYGQYKQKCLVQALEEQVLAPKRGLRQHVASGLRQQAARRAACVLCRLPTALAPAIDAVLAVWRLRAGTKPVVL
eukprot:6189604-Pleurochrysis_carterae.AAC.1